MRNRDWDETVHTLTDRIITLSNDEIEVRGVVADQRSTPDEAWVNVTVRVPDAVFEAKHDEAFHNFKQKVRRTVDDLIGDEWDFRVLYVSDEAYCARYGDAA